MAAPIRSDKNLTLSITLDINEEDPTQVIMDMHLSAKNYPLDHFYVQGNELNETGYKLVSDMAAYALSLNIHEAHQAGVIDSAAHFRKVLNHLEELFVAQVQIRKNDTPV